MRRGLVRFLEWWVLPEQQREPLPERPLACLERIAAAKSVEAPVGHHQPLAVRVRRVRHDVGQAPFGTVHVMCLYPERTLAHEHVVLECVGHPCPFMVVPACRRALESFPLPPTDGKRQIAEDKS